MHFISGCTHDITIQRVYNAYTSHTGYVASYLTENTIGPSSKGHTHSLHKARHDVTFDILPPQIMDGVSEAEIP